MRITCTILLFFIYSAVYAQADTEGLKKAVAGLNTALLVKDSVALKSLLSDKVTYGHSNGWIETKQEVVQHLFDGTLTYNSIIQGEPSIVLEGDIASVRANADVDVSLKGTQVKLGLHILQVWKKDKKRWVLLSRQSTKI